MTDTNGAYQPWRLALGKHAVAEHPSGHRIVGIVTGFGSHGVILASPSLQAGFLDFREGWTCTVTDDTPDPSAKEQP